jgi:DNA polymerase-3 subunit gamma/tau
MVLVRLAYAADLPPPGELARRLADGAGAASAEAGRPAPNPSRKPEPARAETRGAQPPRAEPRPAARAEPRPAADETTEPAPPPPELNSFEDVVALAEAKRDLKLKRALTEQVRPVRFKPGTIENNPLPQAPRELGQELMRKLKAWTGRVGMVAVSDDEGALPLGVQRRDQDARAIAAISEHPAVKVVMQHFPGARIAAVRPVAEPEPPAEGAEEPDEFKEDGTN